MEEDFPIQDEDQNDVDDGADYVEVEVAVVVDADAVVDPGAVVVEPLHTPVADIAVARPLRPDHLALWAQMVRIESFDEREEVHLFVLLQVARVLQPAQHEEYHRHREQQMRLEVQPERYLAVRHQVNPQKHIREDDEEEVEEGCLGTLFNLLQGGLHHEALQSSRFFEEDHELLLDDLVLNFLGNVHRRPPHLVLHVPVRTFNEQVAD